MKTTLLLLCVMGLASADAAVTLGFSLTGHIAEGWANSSGSQISTMVWGILVDTSGDGFDGFQGTTSLQAADGGWLVSGGVSYDPGFNLTRVMDQPAGAGQLLTISGNPSDDRLFIANNLMPLVGGDVRIATLANMSYDAAMAEGDRYAIVWFDSIILNSTVNASSKFGAWYKEGSTPTTATVLPADPGAYIAATLGPSAMFGEDGSSALKVASLHFIVPEPSAALLGLLGAGTLPRRRR